MHVVKKKLNETFVERSSAQQHSANAAEFDSRKFTAMTKKKMASCLNQFESGFRPKMTRIALLKCTAEKILKSTSKALLNDVLQGVKDALKTGTRRDRQTMERFSSKYGAECN